MGDKITEKQLTAREEKFCLEFAACLNQTRAYVNAGYSPNGARQSASKLLAKPYIRARVNELLEQQTMPAKEVLARLTSHAQGDISDLVDPATNSIDWKKAQDNSATHLIKKLRETVITSDDKQTIITEVELYSAQDALVHLGRAYGLFTDKLEVNDWKSRAIADIRAGKLTREALAEAFDENLAADLFRMAGVVPVIAS